MTKKIVTVAKDGKRPVGAVAVVVMSLDIRRYVKRMIELDVPDLPVVSYQDLAGDARVISLGQVSVLSLGGRLRPIPTGCTVMDLQSEMCGVASEL